MNVFERNKERIPLIRTGRVVSVGGFGNGIIKAYIEGIDDERFGKVGADLSELPSCVPLLPRYFTTLPKIGELVYIFQYDYSANSPKAKFQNMRFYMGPVISNLTKLDFDQEKSAESILPWGNFVDSIPQPLEEGAYGIGQNDIVLQGRYNTDIIQKENQMWLRAGKFLEGAPTKFNSTNLGYVQIKYGGEKLKNVTYDVKVEQKIDPIANESLLVELKTYVDTQALPLPNNLDSDAYKSDNVLRTTLTIVKKDLDNISTPAVGYNPPDFLGTNSREQAITDAQNWVNSNRGSKWLIECDSPDFLNNYPNIIGIQAKFSREPQIITKTEKRQRQERERTDNSSVINIVANKINFLSHDGEHSFDLTNPKEMISTDTQEKINSDAHPLVYGDTLVKFLELVKTFVKLHVHPYNGLPPDPSTVQSDVLNFDLETILNKNINSN